MDPCKINRRGKTNPKHFAVQLIPEPFRMGKILHRGDLYDLCIIVSIKIQFVIYGQRVTLRFCRLFPARPMISLRMQTYRLHLLVCIYRMTSVYDRALRVSLFQWESCYIYAVILLLWLLLIVIHGGSSSTALLSSYRLFRRIRRSFFLANNSSMKFYLFS